MTKEKTAVHILNVRLPQEVKQELEKRAQSEFRTLSGEVVKRLVESLEREQCVPQQ